MPYSPDDLAVLGLRVTHGGIDLGVISDFGFTPDITTVPIESTRNGKVEIVREVVTRVSLTITFSTANILDPAVIALFTGGAGGALAFEATEGALVVTQPNAETGGKEVVFNITNAALRGVGVAGTPGTEAARYNFSATALSADGAALGTLTAGVPTP